MVMSLRGGCEAPDEAIHTRQLASTAAAKTQKSLTSYNLSVYNIHMEIPNYEIRDGKVIIDQNLFAFYKNAFETAQNETDKWLGANRVFVDDALRESELEMKNEKYLDGRAVFADLRKKHGF